MTTRQPRLARDAFRLFRPIPTRWSDNDIFAHVNNVVYYSWFDTAVTGWLLESGHLDASKSLVVPLVVETTCTYFESVAFPETVEVGLAVDRLGTSSVTYRLGIFRKDGTLAAAQGRFTHVYVERATQKPVAIPALLRAALEALGG
jgi:acyl-CoA thioester hydrolase